MKKTLLALFACVTLLCRCGGLTLAFANDSSSDASDASSSDPVICKPASQWPAPVPAAIPTQTPKKKPPIPANCPPIVGSAKVVQPPLIPRGLMLQQVVVPSKAATEVSLGIDYSDLRNGGFKARTGSLTGELLFGVSPRITFGPSVQADYVQGTRGGVGVGFASEATSISSTLHPFIGVQALYWTGAIGADLQWREAVRAGLKMGEGPIFVKGFLQYAKDRGINGFADVKDSSAQVAFGYRF